MLSKSDKPDSSISAWHFARWGLPIMTVSARHLHAQTLFWLQGSRNVKYESFSTWLINIDLWKRHQWWNIDKTTLRIRCDQFWFPKARSRDARAQNMSAYIFGRRIAVRGAQEEPWFKSAQSLLHTMSSPHQPNARSFARVSVNRISLYNHQRSVSAPNSPSVAWQKNTTTRIQHGDSKFAPLRSKRLCPALVTAEWLSESEREDAVLAVWRKGKVRGCHLTEGAHFVYIRFVYDSVTRRVWLLAAFSSFPEERHLSSVINGDASADKDARASCKSMRWDTMQYAMIFGFLIIIVG